MQNWNSSWKFCWSHNATLAMIKEKSALDTIYSNKGEENYWIGLRKEPQGWRWVDGSPFINDIISLEKEGQNMACAYLNTLVSRAQLVQNFIGKRGAKHGLRVPKYVNKAQLVQEVLKSDSELKIFL
ncbi:hypothetical protein Y1Q_0000781 [Alligator mississippiensis]|uniref:C-type lectin domain-containing protein n=1 Tax=Alligator mississippiensis TaxID=8496 RepID=A0A151N944_ALLMI|nr:hypothetical protein Y1Q_0000781 [Alligator mississippiensis]